MLELLKSIDAFAWGPPLLILLVGTGIYLTARLGLLQVLRLSKAFQLIFTKDKGHGDVSSFGGTMYSPGSDSWYGEILLGWRQLSRSVAQEPSFGCGWLLSLAWLPSMRKVPIPNKATKTPAIAKKIASRSPLFSHPQKYIVHGTSCNSTVIVFSPVFNG